MTYISVNDAVERTGKGQTTIYRFCRKFEHTRHIKREDKKFLIDEDFLSKHLVATEGDSDAKAEQAKPELIDVFIEELLKEKRYYRQLLDRKDEQLVRKDGIISSLQERQKELHYLLNHQTQLLESARIPDPAPQELKPEKEKTEKKGRQQLMEAKVVYAILGAVAFMLLLAIIFVDELRTLVN